jgi:predicted AAA+ superfamily ATPase
LLVPYYLWVMINRDLANIIGSFRKKGKAILLIGPRQVGKTTLLRSLFSTSSSLWLNGDDPIVRERLTDAGPSFLKTLLGNQQLVVIDEAQRIPNIGLVGKQIVDQFPELELFITGSSALELSNNMNEPMTGRKWVLHLLPISFGEMVNHHGIIEELGMLEQRMLYGYYPEIITHTDNTQRRISELCESYLYKDVYALERIQKPDKFERLLKLLAFQVGQQVSYNELAKNTGLDVATIERYIELLERAFVVFKVPSYQRNLRNELKKSKKIYFYDNGIRNAIIQQWSPLNMRQDTGQLWENLMMSERKKMHNNDQKEVQMYFWRTAAQQEVDLVEVTSDNLFAFEFKWNDKAKGKVNATFIKAYPEAQSMCIHPKNIELFLLKQQL